MAELRLFTPDQLAERRKPKRQQRREAKERMIEHFRTQFTDAGPGFGGEVLLEEGDDKRKTRGLLKEAAARVGLELRFRPIKDPSRIEFSVVERDEQQPTRRGGGRGRRRKEASAGA